MPSRRTLAADDGAGVARVLAELPAERRELAGRAVERAVVVGRARRDRGPQVGRGAAGERRPAGPDRGRLRGRRCCRRSGRPCSAANRTTRPCHGRPSIVGLNASIASGRTRGSSSARRRRRTQPWAHSGYGTSGWAGIARPPCSWISRDRRAEAPQRPDALLEEQREQVAAEGRDLLADDRPRPGGRGPAPSSGRRPRRRSARGR